MSLTPDQREEVRSLIELVTGTSITNLSRLIPKISEMDKALTRGEGRFERIEERFDSHVENNGNAHTGFRSWQKEHEELSERWRPAVEWILGVRIAWAKIVTSLIIMGLGSAITGVLWLIVYFRGGGGTP